MAAHRETSWHSSSPRQTTTRVAPTSCFICWRVTIGLIRVVAPLSYALIGLGVIGSPLAARYLGERCARWLMAYAVVECAFHAYFVLKKDRMQRITPLPHRCENSTQRNALIEQCIDALRHKAGGGDTLLANVRLFLEGWFVGSKLEQISHEDFARWGAWAFCNKELESMDKDEISELDDLIAWYVRQLLQLAVTQREMNPQVLRAGRLEVSTAADR